MDNSIVIGFANDTKIFELPKDIIKSYPNSILSLYEASETNEKIIIEDMTYEQFQIVYSVITKKTKQWLVPPDILKFMDKYGLVDDALLNLHNFINKNATIKVNEKLSDLNNFINGDGILLPTKCYQQYEKYKEIFKNNKNIMSIQITYYDHIIVCINIFESIPIYCFTGKDVYNDNAYNNNIDGSEPYQIKNIDINNEMDINFLRYHILLKNIKCSNCNQCEKCNILNDVDMNCCKPCDYCNGECFNNENFSKMIYPGGRIIDDTIYTRDNWDYLLEVKYLMREKIGGTNIFKITKCDEQNIIFWDAITLPIFTKDITASLTKIINMIMEDGYDDNTLYRDDFDDGNFKTCRGFLNINNALK